MVQINNSNVHNIGATTSNYKNTEASNVQQATTSDKFKEVFDSYTQEELTPSFDTYSAATPIEMKLRLVGPPAKTAQEAQANLEVLKQKKRAGEEITEDDVVKCMDWWQAMSLSSDLSAPSWENGSTTTYEELNAAGKCNLANADNMAYLFKKASREFEQNLAGEQPTNIVEFNKSLMNITKELYEILKQ